MLDFAQVRENFRKESEAKRLVYKRSIKGRLEKNISKWYVFAYQLLAAFYWCWVYIASPVLRFFRKMFVYIYLIYRNIWEKVVYYYDSDGDKHFSYTRGGVFLAGTIASFYMYAVALGLVFDTTLYFVTVKHNEIVYLTNQQEIDPTIDLHSVQGCHAMPCTDENSIYFRVEATLFNELWNLTHKGELFFPDYIAGAVPVGFNKCTITSYGVRFKLFMRGTNVYPYLLSVSCERVPG